jgi:hypothetical protein
MNQGARAHNWVAANKTSDGSRITGAAGGKQAFARCQQFSKEGLRTRGDVPFMLLNGNAKQNVEHSST